MRTSVAAVALIRRQQEGRTLWLAQWNPRWQRYHFVSGHKRPEESFRQCLVREVAEELQIEEGADFVVAETPPTRASYVAHSESANAETAYTMELFDVELLGDAPERIAADPRNRWLSEANIRAQRTEDGQPVSTTMARLLDAVERGS